MFQPRSSNFDPRVAAIAGHLRAIEKELGAIGQITGRRAASGVSVAANQILDAITPALNDFIDRLRRGQRTARDEAASLGTQALAAGARAGSDALDRLGGQARQRPFAAMAVVAGIGILIGLAVQDWSNTSRGSRRRR